LEKLAASIFRVVQEKWITLKMEAASCVIVYFLTFQGIIVPPSGSISTKENHGLLDPEDGGSTTL
jgi:hypothetical protein